MPLKLEIKRKFTARSDRVKCVDIHPNEPWILIALFNGQANVWNYEASQQIKSFEICDLPVRAAKFVVRKNWIISGSDDLNVRVYNYNTLERVHMWEAHSDYLRSIVIHPTQSFILTGSDDMTIKLWDWDRQWSCIQTFEGHSHYVMQISINPKDNNTFATASLDKTIKVWSLGQSSANFTLEGHDAGINCLDYYCGGDKPYIISGADDRFVKIWDYQTKSCVQTLEGHTRNVSCVAFHPELPIILSGSEDETVRVWHSSTYRLENTLNYGLERIWTISCLRGSNMLALGYDEGSIMLKLGREEPAISMDSSGKIVFAKHADIQTINLKSLFASSGVPGEDSNASFTPILQDGERLPVSTKSMGTCDIYPQSVCHNSNGRFIVACGDGEYIVYTAMALRNKSFGQALEFVWSQQEATTYAIRESSSVIKIFKNFKELRTVRPELGAEQIFGGWLLGVRSSMSALSFYDWDSGELIQRIELSSLPRDIKWNERGQLVSIHSDEATFILRYFPDKVKEFSGTDKANEDGIEEAFDLIEHGELTDCLKTAIWIGDCLLYTNMSNRLQYFVGGEIVTVAHLDRQMYILGYQFKENRVFLADRNIDIVSYSILLSVLEYQTAVMREDFASADSLLPSIPRDQRTRVAHFLEKRGFPLQALAVTIDPEHKFDLALALGKLDLAFELVKQDSEHSSLHKWKQLAEAASQKCQFSLAQECLFQAGDWAALLLLCTSRGDESCLEKIGGLAESNSQQNVAFLAKFLLQDVDSCLQLLIDSGRLPEALMFSRTYCPTRVPELVEKLRSKIRSQNQNQSREKVAASLANPAQYENLFPGYKESLLIQKYLTEQRSHGLRFASSYPDTVPISERNPLDEMLASGKNYENFQQTEIDNRKPVVLNGAGWEHKLIQYDLKETTPPIPDLKKETFEALSVEDSIKKSTFEYKDKVKKIEENTISKDHITPNKSTENINDSRKDQNEDEEEENEDDEEEEEEDDDDDYKFDLDKLKKDLGAKWDDDEEESGGD